jgi:translation initiation factor 2B subunit (eIF-2B alpha/beta/delta family)
LWSNEREHMLSMQRPSAGVVPTWMQRFTSVSVISYAYDLIPFGLCQKIVTDVGSFDTDEESISLLLSYA